MIYYNEFENTANWSVGTFAILRCYYEAIKSAKENGYEFFNLFRTTGAPNTTYKNPSKLHAFKKSFGVFFIC